MFKNSKAVLAAVAGLVVWGTAAQAQETVKIGLIVPMTGGQASTGKQNDNRVKLYMKQAGDTVAGKKIELIVRDDTGVADVTKRIAQEMVANDGVTILTGFGLTPLALAVAPLATQAKVPEIVMMAATSVVTERSPFIVRPAFTQAQTTVPLADWAYKNGIRKVVSIVADYAPGLDSETAFNTRFKAEGGEVLEAIRVPLSTRDFAPFLQRAVDAKPEALFVFVPTGLGAALMKQFVERGLDKSGIKVIGPGDVMDDDLLNGMGDAAIGAVTAHLYSAAHPSAMNKAFVADYKKAYNTRPGFMAVSGGEGLHLTYETL